MSIVELSSVSFAYDKKDVLEEVNLTVPKGEFASIVGPNGGGKTTLVRLILGLLKPRLGQVRLMGDSPEKTRIRVGYIPQRQSVDFCFPISVHEVVMTGRLGASDKGSQFSFLKWFPSRYTKEDFEKADRALEIMLLTEERETPFGALSGGQRQRALIARALCGDPELLILDEPTNNIDPTGMEVLYDLLLRLNRTVTILIITHDLGVVSQYVRSVICVNGRVCVHPTTELDGTVIRDLYGSDIRLIRHDHRCSEHGHDTSLPHHNPFESESHS